MVRGRGQVAEQMKKKIHTIFKAGSFRPYTKPNSQVKYVNIDSNHPPLNVNSIPTSINRRLSSISSNKDSFEEEKGVYQKALVEASYNYKLE